MAARSDRGRLLPGLIIVALLLAVGALPFRFRSGAGDERRAGETQIGIRRPVVSGSAVSARSPVALRSRPTATTPDLRLGVAVRDEHDAPVADARVTVRTPDDLRSQTTDADGQVMVKLPHPERVLVHAAAEGYDEASIEVEAAEGVEHATVVLQRAAEIGGRVVGYRGQPQDLIVLAAVADDPGKLRSAPVTADGLFRLAGLPAGRYILGLQPAGFEKALVEAHVAAGERVEVELALAEMGAVDVTTVLPVRVTAPRQAALRFVQTGADIEIARTLAVMSGGTQRIDALPIGRYGVELTVDGLALVPFQTVDIAPDVASPLTFIWPEGRIAGRVSDPSRPATAATVSAFKIVGSADDSPVRDNNPEIRTEAKADGSYALTGLAAGRYLVMAQRDPLVVTTVVDLAAGEDRSLDLQLERGRTLVAVVRFRGAPIAGARVFATSAPYAESSRSAETDARGLVRLQHVTGRACHVRAVWMDGEDGPPRQAQTDVNLDAGVGVVELELD